MTALAIVIARALFKQEAFETRTVQLLAAALLRRTAGVDALDCLWRGFQLRFFLAA
jgi:hypothetical protein